MRNTREAGHRLRSKKRPRPTLRSGRGSRTNSNTSHHIPVRVAEREERPHRIGAGPEDNQPGCSQEGVMSMCDYSLDFVQKVAERLARFRQINKEQASAHHDALEFPNGKII